MEYSYIYWYFQHAIRKKHVIYLFYFFFVNSTHICRIQLKSYNDNTNNFSKKIYFKYIVVNNYKIWKWWLIWFIWFLEYLKYKILKNIYGVYIIHVGLRLVLPIYSSYYPVLNYDDKWVYYKHRRMA